MKKIITKENILHLILFLSSLNILNWFYKKYIIGSREVFWDLSVNYCAGKIYSIGNTPYGMMSNNPIAECIKNSAGLNEAFAYNYTIPLAKFFSLFSFINFDDLKKYWFVIVCICVYFIFKNSKSLFAKNKNSVLFLLILFFSFGGIFFQSLLTGNISIIAFTLISFSLVSLYKNNIKKFALFIIIASVIKPHFFFYILVGFFYKGKNFYQPFLYSSLMLLSIYIFDLIINKEIFLDFLNTMIAMKSDAWFFSFGGGLGIVSLLEQLPSRTLSLFNIYLPSGPSIFTTIFWIISTAIILIGTFYLFIKRKVWILEKKRIFFTFSFLIITMCLPRMAFYELYITIPAIFYLSNKFFYSSNKFLSNLGFIFLIIMFGVHDINAIFFLLSLMVFLLILFNTKKLDIKF